MTRAEVVFPTVTGEVVAATSAGWVHQLRREQRLLFQTYITEEGRAGGPLGGGSPGQSGRRRPPRWWRRWAMCWATALWPILVDREGSMSSWTPNPFLWRRRGSSKSPWWSLVDANSASASELFAASMRDYDYALIIGTGPSEGELPRTCWDWMTVR